MKEPYQNQFRERMTYNPVKVFFGAGSRSESIRLLSDKRLLVVTSNRGRGQFTRDGVLGPLTHQSQITWIDSVIENPSLQQIQEQIDSISDEDEFDAVVGFGGGSAMDTAKSINQSLHLPSESRSLVRLIEDPTLHSVSNTRLNILFPTTSGTGSEVTPFATIWDATSKRKLSMSSEAVFPNYAFVDSELTFDLPYNATLNTALDSLNQAMESCWSKRATPVSLSLATRSLVLGIKGLTKLSIGVLDADTREFLSESSLLAGMAISHTRTALCHSISYPITSYFGVPHGLACAFTMNSVLELNLTKDDGRFTDLSRALVGTSDTRALVQLLRNLLEALSVRDRVRSYVPSLRALLDLSSEMTTPGRSGNNLNDEFSLETILLKSWEE